MDERQAPPRISVTARDPERLRALLRARPYSRTAADIDVSKAYVGDLAQGHRDRVSVRVAAALERALECAPGELFQLDPDLAEMARPYLP